MGTGAGEVFGMVPVQRFAKILGHLLCDVIRYVMSFVMYVIRYVMSFVMYVIRYV